MKFFALKVWSFALLLQLSSCITPKPVTWGLAGIYFQQENLGVRLIFDKNKFLYVDTYEDKHAPAYACCDTISYGYWELDGPEFLKLYSAPELFSFLDMKMIVRESHIDSDSVYFEIANPLEREYDRNDRPVEYSIFAPSIGVEALYYPRKYDSGHIVLPNPENEEVRTFRIIVSPTCQFDGRNMGIREAMTVQYEVRDPSSNFFKIEIPDLTYVFMTCERLNGDYVKIVDRNRLIWDDYIYLRQK